MSIRFAQAWGVAIAAFLPSGCGLSLHGNLRDQGGDLDRHPRYVRAINLPPDASGEVCTALDARVFAHAASASLAGLQVREVQAGRLRPTAFRLTESGTAPAAAVTAPVTGVHAGDGELDFSLGMPSRPYSAVELGLAMHDFVGYAELAGVDWQGSEIWLGQQPVFDQSARGLGRSTRVELAEERFPGLRVRLRLRSLDGKPLHGVTAGSVLPASVPASRESQTVFTTVAATDDVTPDGEAVVAELEVPRHVPVERVALKVDGTGDFLRRVTVTTGSDEAVDVLHGSVARVRLPVAEGKSVIYERLTVEAVLAANVRKGARVLVRVEDDGGGKLPVRRVELQMRERKLCFAAHRGSRYELAYGGLLMPSREEQRNTDEPVGTVTGSLGEERVEGDELRAGGWKGWVRRQPELLWVLALGMIAMLAARMRVHLRQGRRAL